MWRIFQDDRGHWQSVHRRHRGRTQKPAAHGAVLPACVCGLVVALGGHARVCVVSCTHATSSHTTGAQTAAAVTTRPHACLVQPADVTHDATCTACTSAKPLDGKTIVVKTATGDTNSDGKALGDKMVIGELVPSAVQVWEPALALYYRPLFFLYRSIRHHTLLISRRQISCETYAARLNECSTPPTPRCAPASTLAWCPRTSVAL